MWVKICGIKDAASAAMAAEYRPDAVGLNFHPPSPRFVELDKAKTIASLLPAEIQTVGVFVNPPLCEIASVCYGTRLDFAQLHGDEPPEFLAEIHDSLPELQLIRAWRMGPEGLDDWAAYFDRCRDLGVSLAGCLLDARTPGLYGGSGKTVAWDVVARDYDYDRWPKLILAGGLTPANVREAVGAVNPWGVDTATGVESSPAVKDSQLMRNFIANARSERS